MVQKMSEEKKNKIETSYYVYLAAVPDVPSYVEVIGTIALPESKNEECLKVVPLKISEEMMLEQFGEIGKRMVEEANKEPVYKNGIRCFPQVKHIEDFGQERWTGKMEREINYLLSDFDDSERVSYHEFNSDYDLDMCGRCSKQAAYPAPCPYAKDVHGEEHICNCCDTCRSDCAMDI